MGPVARVLEEAWSEMTLLVAGVRYWYRCSTGHRFVRAKRDAFPAGWCPKCGMPIQLYGLADSTTYADETPLPQAPPDQPDTSAH